MDGDIAMFTARIPNAGKGAWRLTATWAQVEMLPVRLIVYELYYIKCPIVYELCDIK